jgi:transposase
MPKAHDYRLNEDDLVVIEKAIRHDPRPEVRQRCLAVRLLHLGHKPYEVAEMQAVSVPTIYGWIKRWQQAGLGGLATKPRSGRPTKTDEAYCHTLESVLDQDPQDLGYDFALWTIGRLRAHLEKVTGIALSDSRLRVLMKAKGYRYRRPKYDLGHLQDKDAKTQAAALLEELKKRPQAQELSSSLWTKRP